MQNKIIKNLVILFIMLMFGADYANAANYMQCEQAMSVGKPFILYLHSNGCYACKQFTPIFGHVMDSMPDYNVVDVNYSYPQKANICSSAQSKTIPAVDVVNPQKRTRSKINFNIYFKQNEFKAALLQLLKE